MFNYHYLSELLIVGLVICTAYHQFLRYELDEEKISLTLQSSDPVFLSHMLKVMGVRRLSNDHRGMPGPEHFLDRIKRRESAMSDKFTGDKFKSNRNKGGHYYHTIYGIFLDGYIHHMHKLANKVKMFEIGLGCDMFYGPGASARTWRYLYPDPEKTELWFAEINKDCVHKASVLAELEKLHIKTVVGDQSNISTLSDWVTTTGGNFDIIIDDGSHKNHDIIVTFNKLFYEALAPGGLYFIEDLQVGRTPPWYDNTPPFADIIKEWIDQLLITPEKHFKHTIPKRIKWITCQAEACVIGKCYENDIAKCSG